MNDSNEPLNRYQKFCQGIEEILEALTCDGVVIDGVQDLPGGGARLTWHVRWWNQATWVGWFRTVVLGDQFGRGFYERRDEDV